MSDPKKVKFVEISRSGTGFLFKPRTAFLGQKNTLLEKIILDEDVTIITIMTW